MKIKSNWIIEKQIHASKKGNSYNWDYNTWYNYHYYGEYGHILENCIKTHFRGNYKKWLNGEIVLFSCLKVGHINKKCRTRAPTPNNRKLKIEGKKTWIEIVRVGSSGARKAEINQSNGSSDHTTSN